VGGVAELDAAGKPVELASVQVSAVPAAGTVVPPELTVVEALLPKRSTAARTSGCQQLGEI
jgi:hypothetical protein